MAVSVTVGKSLTRNVPNALVQLCANYSQDKLQYIENPTLERARRGTGYRSSFNGQVCTVFGAGGFLGRNIVGRLGRYGTQIIVPHRADLYDVFPLRVYGDLGQIHFTPFWIDDDETFRRALKYSTIAINCMGMETDTKSTSLEKLHIDAARKVAKTCREMGIKRLIHISALNCSPNPKGFFIKNGSRFYKTKYYGELAVREEFPDAIIIRPSDVVGWADRFFLYYMQHSRLIGNVLHLWNKGLDTIKQPLYIKDFARGIYEIFRRRPDETAGKTYQFVGPHGYILHDLCKHIFHVQRKDDYWGFKIEDARLDVQFRIFLEARNSAIITRPVHGFCKERFERECTTDVIDPNLPTIGDLGVSLTSITDVAYDECFIRNAMPDTPQEPWLDDPPPMPRVVRSL